MEINIKYCGEFKKKSVFNDKDEIRMQLATIFHHEYYCFKRNKQRQRIVMSPYRI